VKLGDIPDRNFDALGHASPLKVAATRSGVFTLLHWLHRLHWCLRGPML
jgi:hypothetical protein